MARLIRTPVWAASNGAPPASALALASEDFLVSESMMTEAIGDLSGAVTTSAAQPNSMSNNTAESMEAVATRRVEAQARAEERRKISRLLHDDVGQSLTAVNVKLAILRARATGALQEEIRAAQSLLEKTMEQVQRLSQELHPSAVEDLGLIAALRCHIKNFSEKSAIPVQLKADEGLRETGPEVALALFRSIQALLTDLERAAVSNTKLTLATQGDAVIVEARAQFCAATRRRFQRSGKQPGAQSADASPHSETVPDVSRFHEQVLIAGGIVKFRASRNQAVISARFPTPNQTKANP